MGRTERTGRIPRPEKVGGRGASASVCVRQRLQGRPGLRLEAVGKLADGRERIIGEKDAENAREPGDKPGAPTPHGDHRQQPGWGGRETSSRSMRECVQNTLRWREGVPRERN